MNPKPRTQITYLQEGLICPKELTTVLESENIAMQLRRSGLLGEPEIHLCHSNHLRFYDKNLLRLFLQDRFFKTRESGAYLGVELQELVDTSLAEGLISVSTIAEEVECNPMTVRSWIHRGLISSINISLDYPRPLFRTTQKHFEPEYEQAKTKGLIWDKEKTAARKREIEAITQRLDKTNRRLIRELSTEFGAEPDELERYLKQLKKPDLKLLGWENLRRVVYRFYPRQLLTPLQIDRNRSSPTRMSRQWIWEYIQRNDAPFLYVGGRRYTTQEDWDAFFYEHNS